MDKAKIERHVENDCCFLRSPPENENGLFSITFSDVNPKVQRGKQSAFEKALRKLMEVAAKNEVHDHEVEYFSDTLRHNPEFSKVDGWCKFIATAHSHQLIDKIYSGANSAMAPAAEAILDGEVGVVQSGARVSGPTFTFDTMKAAAWLVDEGATQKDAAANGDVADQQA